MQTHEILRKYFERKRKSQRGFSLRGLAQRVDLSPSFLSRVLAGKKPVPYELLLKLAAQLDIEPEVLTGLKKAYLGEPEDARPAKKGRVQVETQMEEWSLGDKRALTVLRQWFYLPILEMTSLEDFDGSVGTIARRLGLSKTTAEVAVKELVDLGLMKETKTGYRKTNRKVRLSSGKSLPEIRRFHSMMMTRAQKELETATGDEAFARRLITGITVTASPSKIEWAKGRLSECLHEIANALTEDAGTEVYQLAAQLFPLTKA